jgi:PTS system mannose-specific IID component
VFSIAASLALQGNPISMPIVLLCALGIWYVRYQFTMIGYKQGQKIAFGMGVSLKNLTEAASILGLTVIGAMVPTTVKASFTDISFKMGFSNLVEVAEDGTTEIVRNIQTDLLDKILPFMVPLGIVFFAYWLLGQKKMSSTKLIIVLFVLGFVLGNIGNLINGTLMW